VWLKGLVVMDVITTPEYMDFDGIAKTFGISRSRQYLLIADGSIRAVRMVGRVRVEAASVRDYMRSLPAPVLRGAKLAE
jgi:excisionase family DNA binding protein